MNTFRIAPGILPADFAKLGEEVSNVIGTGADLIHFDVMDNRYVPNLTIGPMVCSAIKPYTTVPVDIHLIVEPVDDLIQSFGKAEADIITFRPEASKYIDRSSSLVKSMGCQVGLILNPATPVNLIENVLDKLDMVLLISADPGFGGQNFIPHTLIRIRQVRGMLGNYESRTERRITLEVDGGTKTGNIAKVAVAGADTFVAGSAIFSQPDYKAVINGVRKELAKV